MEVDLQTSAFIRSQHYIALLQVTSAQRVGILLSENNDRKTNNLVYPKILLWLPQAYQDKIIHKSIKYNDEPNCEFDFLLNLIHRAQLNEAWLVSV